MARFSISEGGRDAIAGNVRPSRVTTDEALRDHLRFVVLGILSMKGVAARRLRIVVSGIWVRTWGVLSSVVCKLAAEPTCYLVFHISYLKIIPN
jgi:hypothetical protein